MKQWLKIVSLTWARAMKGRGWTVWVPARQIGYDAWVVKVSDIGKALRAQLGWETEVWRRAV